MTRLRSMLLALAALTAVGGGARADEDAKAALRKPNITVEMRCLSVPQAAALPLVRRLRSTRPEEKAASSTELDTLLARGQATPLGWSVVTVREGEKGTAENIEMVRYGRYYQAGTVAVCLTDRPSEPRREPAVVEAPTVAGIDTRQVGMSFEAEATPIPGGQALDLAFYVRFVGWPATDRFTVERERVTEKKTTRMVVELPRFSAIAHLGFLTLENREQRLVHVSADPKTEGRLLLFMLTADIEARK